MGAANRKTRVTFAQRVGLALAAIGLAFSVSACSGGGTHPNAAVIVNGTAISEDEVTSLIDDELAISGQELPRNYVIQALAQAQAYLDAAEELGFTMTQEEVLEEADLTLQMAGAPFRAEDLGPGMMRYMNSQLVSLRVGQAGQAEELDALAYLAEVELNPRYSAPAAQQP